MNAGLLVFILLLLLSFLGIPIFISLGIGTLIALNMADLPMLVLPQKLFAGMNSSSLLAIPFFVLSGNIMAKAGIQSAAQSLVFSLPVGDIAGLREL